MAGTGLKTIFATALTQAYSTDIEGLGRIRIDDDNNVYRWVQNAITNVDQAA